ncbi:MAG: N-acetylmuramoyl-L-alanine amidase [Oscillospiraceae bacterium]|nr:N-acetylmuramoyl-L-alanine amidase [Oscillospiraceae bacterium]
MISTLVLVVCYLVAVGFADNIKTAGEEKAVVTSTAWVSENDLPTIILDAGHGGMDGGCVSYNGVSEKGINLNIMLNLKALLEAYGYEVVVTRDSDKSIHDEGITGLSNQKKSDMKNRLEIFNSCDNAIALSIHQNQYTDSKYNGAQMFYSETNPDSVNLALCLQQAFVDNIQPDNEREVKLTGDDLYLIYYAEVPSVMIECGFLSNPEEADLLMTESYQKKVAFTIFKGINDYLGKA